ncbi:hypothetical protein [Roseinatronobacter sp. NSM]|uniref:hypothetical protein n=1 Tax=Roseinatronobacter sp. NSM TaxID=3457785 RepID=UPI004035EE96
MKIESKIKRPKGTFIEMADGTRYAFFENDKGAHVADVENPTHIERLLAIPEGFGIYNEGKVIPAADVEAAINDLVRTPETPVNPQPQTDPEPAANGEGEGEATGEHGEGGASNDDNGPNTDDAIPLEAMTETDLRALFESELGRKPHHRAGMDKLIEDITAHRAAQAE